MIAATRGNVKTAPTRTRVIFDAGTPSPAPATFGRGILPTPRWTGQHDHSPFDQDDLDWAAAVFLDASAAEIEAEDDAYNQMLEQMAFEDAAVSRLSRGHCL